MLAGKPSQTALRVAIRRAAHVLADPPPVLDDPIAVQLIGGRYPRDLERAMHKVGRDFRAYMAARSRFAEDHLAQPVAAGTRQYVVLGAGLDTFACRNPFPDLRVFEVDYPATQEWKRSMFAEAGIPAPASLTFVPHDFEHKTLSQALTDCGFDAAQTAYFSWLGVVPYLTIEAFRTTLAAVVQLPEGSGITFDYGHPRESLTPARQEIFDRLANRVAAAGEPFQLFFTPDQIEVELRAAGFHKVEQADHGRLNELYFRDRSDGLKLSPVGIGTLVTAWV
jgi:methyltransferase (TIGR00027 family)